MALNSVYLLIDCNNFYVSCERLFNPSLQEKPVIVLSNNDGCAISRSNEAKVLGIPMGAPLFKIKDLVKAHGVEVFSSNYALYQDLSNRVMQTLFSFNNPLEVYSVDEAFMKLDSFQGNLIEYGLEVKKRVLDWTGIPVSIGFGKTKTLAKLANNLAKTSSKSRGVCDLSSVKDETMDLILQRTPLKDIWGIGRRIEKKLIADGIHTPYSLTQQSDMWIRKNLSVCWLSQ